MVLFLSFSSSSQIVNTIGKRPQNNTNNTENSKNTENKQNFQCNWLTSDRVSFPASDWEKKSYFSVGHASGEENRVAVCCE